MHLNVESHEIWESSRRRSPALEGVGRVCNEKDRPHVVVAEDDAAMRELLVYALSMEGFRVSEFRDGSGLFVNTAGNIIFPDRHGVDLIVSDIRMPGYTGLEFLEKIRALHWMIPVIIVTAFGTPETHDRALDLGAAAVFDKPFEIRDLMDAVHSVLKRGNGRA
jgi:DNA-binding response OmpR family regulator